MTNFPAVQVRHATVQPTLHAALFDLRPIVYDLPEAAEQDVPPYLRAASGLRRHAGRLAVIQDDVNEIVLMGNAGEITTIPLPAGPGGQRVFDDRRGNKRAKMDLEACTTLPDGRFVAFGSGSRHARERLVVVAADNTVRIVQGADLYAALRRCPTFSGSELNIEGAVVVGDRLRLFQRGNGLAAGTLLAVNATCDLLLAEFLAWLDHDSSIPHLLNVIQYDLGAANGTPFTFTDAALMRDGRIAFLACAEASPDTFLDGDVLGCRFGVADGDVVSLAEIRLDGREPAMIKLEGIEERPDDASTFDVVADMDDPDTPAKIGRLEVREGPWPGIPGPG